jgi:hypothetical protein
VWWEALNKVCKPQFLWTDFEPATSRIRSINSPVVIHTGIKGLSLYDSTEDQRQRRTWLARLDFTTMFAASEFETTINTHQPSPQTRYWGLKLLHMVAESLSSALRTDFTSDLPTNYYPTSYQRNWHGWSLWETQNSFDCTLYIFKAELTLKRYQYLNTVYTKHGWELHYIQANLH